MDKKISEENHKDDEISCWECLLQYFFSGNKLNGERSSSHVQSSSYSKARSKGSDKYSRVFRYSPLSYSRNFEGYWRDDDDFDDFSLRSFSSSETCLMEELLLVKDVGYYGNVEDVITLDNLDSCLPSNNTNIISSSNGNAEYCSSFQDYYNFPMDMIQSFNYPISYGEFTQSHYSNIHDFQQDYYTYAAHAGSTSNDQSMVVPNLQAAPPCKDEPVGFCPETESKNKPTNKVPSKNLMAERRRRKRLNDRLSMLRSVVPKISKMDRTSILGDTIDYMKELLERINHLQEEIMDEGVRSTIFKANEILVRNSPKMEVEKKGNGETRIKINCGMKPGLLLSTMKTVEELGLEIQQCVVSCFSDFTMQASCSQELKEMDVEDIKQAVFRNIAAGISLTSTFV